MHRRAYGGAVDDPDHLDAAEPPDAFARARQLRGHRERLVKQVGAGEASLEQLFDQHDSDCRVGTVKVVVLAEQVPGVGKVRARRAMQALGIADDARWGEVGRDRLRALWAAMAEAASRPL